MRKNAYTKKGLSEKFEPSEVVGRKQDERRNQANEGNGETYKGERRKTTQAGDKSNGPERGEPGVHDAAILDTIIAQQQCVDAAFGGYLHHHVKRHAPNAALAAAAAGAGAGGGGGAGAGAGGQRRRAALNAPVATDAVVGVGAGGSAGIRTGHGKHVLRAHVRAPRKRPRSELRKMHPEPLRLYFETILSSSQKNA